MCMKNGVPIKPAKGACGETHGQRNYSTPTYRWQTYSNSTATSATAAYYFPTTDYSTANSTTTGAW